jgi:membrane protease YdiL (CAAX protease family)
VSSAAHAARPLLASVRTRLALYAALVPALALAEGLAALDARGAALAIDVALVLGLANGALFARSRAAARLLCVLALVPLIRPVVVATSVEAVPREYWPALAGAPLLVAVLWAAHAVDYPLADRLLRSSAPGLRLALLCGPLLGMGAYATAAPPEPQLATPGLLLAGAGLALLVGPSQEILFRGLLQRLVAEAYGPRAVVLVILNCLFAATLLGVSFAFALYMGAVGMAFSTFVRRTGSLGEVVVAHAGLSVFGLLVWPLLLG